VVLKKASHVPRTTALCYVRQSLTRNLSDMDSPERQRDNIERICEAKGWKAEFYQDADGHKSGTKEHNRPEWLRLQARLSDPDVVAVVANDLARLHRKGWRVGRLIDMLEEHSTYLVLAAPGRELDLSKPQDRVAIQIIAMIDEWYSTDAALRLRDSIQYRKRRGITVGIPPFGTWRNEDGYLVPSQNGAWLLPDGSHISGKADQQPPHPDAIWRGYYQCAERMLTLFAENNYGRRQISLVMSQDGWVFRDRNGNPRPINGQDVRRVIANWREYAGLAVGGRAKDKNPARLDDPLTELTETGRNVFPMDLLQIVAQIQLERSYTTNRVSSKKESHDYALSGVLYCAHCEQDAKEKSNPALRATIAGHKSKQKFHRYRHKEGHPCRAQSRSVLREHIEADFIRLVHLLSIDESVLPLLTELAVQSQRGDFVTPTDTDHEEEKRVSIAKCRKRIENARALCLAGDMNSEEYLRIREQNEREIAHWEARTSDIQQKALELTLCMETIEQLKRGWDIAPDIDKQGMVRMLFEMVEYNLDTKRITDYRLKPWADNFVILRAALYEYENEMPHFREARKDEIGEEEDTKNVSRIAPPEGIEPPAFRLEGDCSIR
jgi:DNA invertase Pin-like site-specific DNA recombinase